MCSVRVWLAIWLTLMNPPLTRPQTMQDKVSSTNVVLASVTPGDGFKLYNKERLQELVEIATQMRGIMEEDDD